MALLLMYSEPGIRWNQSDFNAAASLIQDNVLSHKTIHTLDFEMLTKPVRELSFRNTDVSEEDLIRELSFTVLYTLTVLLSQSTEMLHYANQE